MCNNKVKCLKSYQMNKEAISEKEKRKKIKNSTRNVLIKIKQEFEAGR